MYTYIHNRYVCLTWSNSATFIELSHHRAKTNTNYKGLNTYSFPFITSKRLPEQHLLNSLTCLFLP